MSKATEKSDVIKVQLEIFYEQGMEGVEWVAIDNTKQGYHQLITLNDGDYLDITSVWKGYIKRDLVINKNSIRELLLTNTCRDILNLWEWNTTELSDAECKELISYKKDRQTINGYVCNWLQHGVEPSLWLKWFERELPAYYCKNNVN